MDVVKKFCLRNDDVGSVRTALITEPHQSPGPGQSCVVSRGKLALQRINFDYEDNIYFICVAKKQRIRRLNLRAVRGIGSASRPRRRSQDLFSEFHALGAAQVWGSLACHGNSATTPRGHIGIRWEQ